MKDLTESIRDQSELILLVELRLIIERFLKAPAYTTSHTGFDKFFASRYFWNCSLRRLRHEH